MMKIATNIVTESFICEKCGQNHDRLRLYADEENKMYAICPDTDEKIYIFEKVVTDGK